MHLLIFQENHGSHSNAKNHYDFELPQVFSDIHTECTFSLIGP